jgi:hypothetical protein
MATAQIYATQNVTKKLKQKCKNRIKMDNKEISCGDVYFTEFTQKLVKRYTFVLRVLDFCISEFGLSSPGLCKYGRCTPITKP